MLLFFSRNIVGNDEISNVFKSFFFGDVFVSFVDDDGQFIFVVELVILGKFWDGDIFFVVCDGSVWFDENGRVWRRFVVIFLNC